MTSDPERWSQPFAALLGAYDAQIGYGLASIGGKDSMSGTFNDIDVPPTLVSFAVDIARMKEIITPELKSAGDKLVQLWFDRDEYDIPVYEHVMKTYDLVTRLMREGKVKAAYALDAKGLAAGISKMAFGNKLGVAYDDQLKPADLFENCLGDLVLEMLPSDAAQLREPGLNLRIVGEIKEEPVFTFGGCSGGMDTASGKGISHQGGQGNGKTGR